MCCQNDRHPAILGQYLEVFEQPVLCGNVHADGWLVQVENRRFVQERRCNVAAHPLPEAQFPDGLFQELVHIEQLDEERQLTIELRLVDAVLIRSPSPSCIEEPTDSAVVGRTVDSRSRTLNSLRRWVDVMTVDPFSMPIE